MDTKSLVNSYISRKQQIRDRLLYFKREKSDDELFEEFAFCLLTPQSKARSCWASVERLREKGILFNGSESMIRKNLICRFPNNKARFFIEGRKFFVENKEKIKSMFSMPLELREFLVKHVKGYGYKEASHFLRNIGLGNDLAILDRHIIRNLARYGAIEQEPKFMTGKYYLEIEEKMRIFSKKIKIPMDELDLLFWSEEAGEIFK
jgi:N-glycosylase/DNA lyase